MTPESFKKLEDRVAEYSASLPELIARMLYRQLKRGRKLSMDGIDAQISRAARTAELVEACGCSNRHSTGTPFSHWIAGDC